MTLRSLPGVKHQVFTYLSTHEKEFVEAPTGPMFVLGEGRACFLSWQHEADYTTMGMHSNDGKYVLPFIFQRSEILFVWFKDINAENAFFLSGPGLQSAHLVHPLFAIVLCRANRCWKNIPLCSATVWFHGYSRGNRCTLVSS